MIKNEFLAARDLNIDFIYPSEYVEFIKNQEIIAGTPWWLIGNTEGAFQISYETITNVYKSKKLLIPFAKTDQSNILSCFDQDHKIWFTSCEQNDITDADWDHRFHLDGFSAWLDFVVKQKKW